MTDYITRAAIDDDVLDLMHNAYWAEYDRWCVRRKLGKDGYELVRNSSPNNDINADEYMEITNLTKRDLHDSVLSERDRATSWLEIYRGRAAMKKALEAIR